MLEKGGYDPPNSFLKKSMDYLESYYKDSNKDVKKLNGKIASGERKKNKTFEDEFNLQENKYKREVLKKYKHT